jgi:threonyl-tRNA synthetase
MNIETIRHSLAHILAMAVKELYPEVKLGIGPAIENGFYYDFDLREKITPEALLKIEEKMRKIILQPTSFKKELSTKTEAQKLFKEELYKLQIIKEIPEGEISLYRSDNFIDLCHGPHVDSSKEISLDAFKLTRVAGAYWKGSENNPMLQRVYGVAFKTNKELEEYLQGQIEAKKRDHRLIGQKLDLFHADEKIGPGLILWHPKGAQLKKTIQDFVIDEYQKHGYQLVDTPHIAKLNLWETSGHTGFYKENMFPPMHLKEISDKEKDDYQLKPMNCPFHILIYKAHSKSYRDLPLRYTELGTVYRYEKSGVLHGLTRVRGFTQDDAHIWCAPSQLKNELSQVLRFALELLKTFGFKDYQIYLSTRPAKYIGSEKIWEKSTQSLKEAIEKLNIPYEIDEEGGVFYGPKIDIKIKDSLGRAWQCTTIQVDFNLPERFDMTYVDSQGKKERPIMIHRALLGSVERFIGVLLEHYNGDLPIWLSPIQALIIPVSQKYDKEAKEINEYFVAQGIRAQIDSGNKTIGKKIRSGEEMKIPYILVFGQKEKEKDQLTVRKRGQKELVSLARQNIIQEIKEQIKKFQ